MQIAIISDIHGNCFALDLVLADIRRQGIENIVCLGDAIQGGAQPAETVARLREIGCPVVMGNADAWLLDGPESTPNESSTAQQIAVRDWGLTQLSQDDLHFMRQFQPTIRIELTAAQTLLCFHGSPHSFNDIILPETSEETLSGFLNGFDVTLLAGGHTHTQQIRRLDSSSWYLNPGSVGFAFDWRLSPEQFRADPWAEYAIVTSEQESSSIHFCRLPFEVSELARVIRASGKPYAEESLAMYQARD